MVFDGSAKSLTDVSLNNVQQVRPTIQEDFLSILIRMYRVLLTIYADIEKMFQQILVAPHQRPQRILWREIPQESIKTYELNTVIYSTASVFYLATPVLQQISLDNNANHLVRRYYMTSVMIF